MDTELVRPLPWVLFLPFLLWLRFVKMCITTIALLRGKEPLRPLQVVQFIQVRRRRLRAIKYRGMKNYTNWQESQRNLADVQCIFMKLFCNILGFVGLWRVCHTTEVPEGHATSTPEDDKFSVDNEDLTEKINRLCQEFESDDDPDYKPPIEEEIDESVSSGADEDEAMNIGNSATEIPTDSKNLLDIEEVNENLEDSSSTISLESAEACSEATSQTYYSPQGSIGTSPEPDSYSFNTAIPADQKPTFSNTSNNLPSKNSAESAETRSEATSQTYYSPQGSIGTSPEPESCSSNTAIPTDQKPTLSNTSNNLPSKNSAESAETRSEATSQTYYSPQGSIGTSPEPESCSSNTAIPADQKPALSNTSNNLPSKNSAESDSSTTVDSCPTESASSVSSKPKTSEYVSNVNEEDYH